MKKHKITDLLHKRETTVSVENVLDNARADSGGIQDVDFLKYLVDNHLLIQTEAFLKRAGTEIVEEYYLEQYRKMNHESGKHFLCRAIIQDELKKSRINTHSGADVGDMRVLRVDSNYDIVTDDYSTLIDVGLTPARNFFRGLTDSRVEHYLISNYFDDYMDDIVFSIFTRSDTGDFIDAVREYEQGFLLYKPESHEESCWPELL